MKRFDFASRVFKTDNLAIPDYPEEVRVVCFHWDGKEVQEDLDITAFTLDGRAVGGGTRAFDVTYSMVPETDPVWLRAAKKLEDTMNTQMEDAYAYHEAYEAVEKATVEAIAVKVGLTLEQVEQVHSLWEATFDEIATGKGSHQA